MKIEDGKKRVVIEAVSPEIDGGRFPAKRTVGEKVVVEADVFADGHDVLSCRILYRKGEESEWTYAPMKLLVNDRWRGSFEVTETGTYYYTLQAWVDRFLSWRQALAKKAAAGQEISVDLLIGAKILEDLIPNASGEDGRKLKGEAKRLRSSGETARRVELAMDEELVAAAGRCPETKWATAYGRELRVVVEPVQARFSAWYEMFPRSCSAHKGKPGTFKDCESRLPYIAGMGFDIIYFPPIHPIGRTHRKGRNSHPQGGPGDVGSPWAIGAAGGGHKAVHPELGTLEDFRRLVDKAGEHGLEVALDIAFQCTPDHPYVKEHPEWFRRRSDGTIQHAENPPKKYEDIYPLDFTTENWRELWEELKSVVLFWMEQGIRIFRVDNPHTKPFPFWEWLIGEVKKKDPEVIFLAEAFTRPNIMYRLAKLGFSQSYTYFAWRNTKWELKDYFTELTRSEVKEFFRPTLLAWLEEKAPEVYRAILAADRDSLKYFSGHGSALAQVYSHMILPLANGRDKFTQIFWGIGDFQHRFGRAPEGMWLSETAVDLETLDILARLGIKFTILAPRQAHQVRRFRGRNWVDVSGGRIDPSGAYALRLPSGQRMNLFFYDGPISQAVAFEKLLANGDQFAGRLMNAFSDRRTWPQLAHIATDGETYGHHHRFGDMALAYALRHIEANGMARLTNYGEFLEKHPPNHEIRIFENSSWSCVHGIERWRGNCGCNSGMNPGWNQEWRAPLREALDWLRDTMARSYEEKGRQWLKDPWAARDDYIRVILDRSPESVDRFFQDHAAFPLSEADRIRVRKLLELQRHAMLMYTSCGWFFDELSGIETVQVIQYAGRAIQLSEDLFGDSLEPQFLERLEKAKSNIPDHRDGRHIYEKFVKPATVNLEKVGAHYAIRSLFEPYAEHDRIYCFAVDREEFKSSEAGKMKLCLGRARFTSRITGESVLQSFGVLHFGDHNVNGGVREFRGEEAYQSLVQEISEVFSRADLPEVIRLLDRNFGKNIFSLRSLFRDERGRILNRILKSNLADAEAVFGQLHEKNAPLMRFLIDLGTPLPKSFRAAAGFSLNRSLRDALAADAPPWIGSNLSWKRPRGLKLPWTRSAWGMPLRGPSNGWLRGSAPSPRTWPSSRNWRVWRPCPAACPSRWICGACRTFISRWARRSTPSSAAGQKKGRIRPRPGWAVSPRWAAS